MARKPIWPAHDTPKPALVPPPKQRPPKAPKFPAAAPYDPHVDQPVFDNGEPSPLTLPVQQLSRLTRDPGRGMMPMRGKLDPVYSRYLEGLDLDELKFALAQDASPKASLFLAALVNPDNRNQDITTLAKLHSIGLTEMMQIWRNHKLTTAMGVYIDAAPTLAAHVVEDAQSTTICCNRCDGAGDIRIVLEDGPHWISCPTCQGEGSIRKVGDTKARELVFKSLGFVKNDGGVNVQITNNSNTVESVIEELERLNPAIDITPEET